MRAVTLLAAALLASALLASAPRARAQDADEARATEEAQVPEDPAVAEARALFARGRALADQRRFVEAAVSFERSYELAARPSTAFNLALCHYALERHVQAIELLERYEAQANPVEEGPAYQEAMAMLAHARQSVATIVLEVAPPDAHVSLDGEDVGGGATRSVTVNAGAHVVRAHAPSHQGVLLEIEVSRGETTRRAVSLADARVPARLSVQVAELPDAQIEIDGEITGEGMAQLELDAGEHRLRITHARIAPHDRTLDLDWGEHASIQIEPVELQGGSIADEPALWIGLGIGALVIAAAVAIPFVVVDLNAPSGGSTGVVVSASSRTTAAITW